MYREATNLGSSGGAYMHELDLAIGPNNNLYVLNEEQHLGFVADHNGNVLGSFPLDTTVAWTEIGTPPGNDVTPPTGPPTMVPVSAAYDSILNPDGIPGARIRGIVLDPAGAMYMYKTAQYGGPKTNSLTKFDNAGNRVWAKVWLGSNWFGAVGHIDPSGSHIQPWHHVFRLQLRHKYQAVHSYRRRAGLRL